MIYEWQFHNLFFTNPIYVDKRETMVCMCCTLKVKQLLYFLNMINISYILSRNMLSWNNLAPPTKYQSKYFRSENKVTTPTILQQSVEPTPIIINLQIQLLEIA